MSDKPNQQPAGDDASSKNSHLSDTWVPEQNQPTSKNDKSSESQLDQTIMGPPVDREPVVFEGDMTFVGPQSSPSEVDDIVASEVVVPMADSTDDTDATFVGSFEDDSEDKDKMPAGSESWPKSDDDVLTATFVGAMSESTDVDDADESEDPNNFATIVPVGNKERGTDGDPFTATIVGQVPEVPENEQNDETGERTAVLPSRRRDDARRDNPNLTQGANADRTFEKTAPHVRKEQPRAEAPDLDATFVSASSDGAERPRDRMEQTAGLSNSGSKGPEGSQPGQNIKSNIWVGQNHTSVDELVSIRRRPVAGTGQFAVEEGMDATEADFEIIEKLAEGGMGVVYVAKQKSLNRELAIKTLKGSSGSTSATMKKSSSGKQMSRAERQKREMFLSEALVTANLVHPNIIPIHELAETADGMPYYVMKRVHGIPWNKRIREMSLQENLDVLHKACDAIAYAHHHGVINRDLKPENIMLGEFGEVLVLDWGLAVPAPHAAEQNFRSPVASYGAGTPAYMSPELWMGPPEAIGECSDIYLLGAILFEIVTGNPPHEFPKVESKAGRSDLWQTIDNVLRINKIRDVSESGELLDIAMKALRTNPDERFGSVLEFQFAVRNYQRHEESRRLSARATELVGEKAERASLSAYHTYQTAAALFEESLRTWPQNTLARNGLRTTRLRYAQLASQKGDYDLGLQVTAQEPSDPEFITLAKKLSQARAVRSSVKWTALAAIMLVVALGAKSIYDNGIITNLNAEVTARKAEATEAIAAANDAKAEANTAVAQAETAKAEATRAQDEAVVAQREAEQSRAAAARSNEQALAARDEATKAQEAAEKSRMSAAVAVAQAEEASKKVAEANIQLAAAEKSEAEARERQNQAETAAKVAQVEIQSQAIRGLTLNENYSDALRQLDRLLESELLPQLPEEIRAQRTVELNAQREQLLKRTRRSDEPIQSQAISPDGKQIAFGDSAGRITVLSNPSADSSWSSGEASSIALPQAIESIRFISDTAMVITAGSSLHLWTIGEANAMELKGHEATISGIDVQGNSLLSGDDAGRILVWNLESRRVVAEMTVKSSIRDVAWIPSTRDFIYAATRGGQSADILAYRVPDSSAEAEERARPERLGQLELSRTHNDAPLRVSVSPDGQILVISNSNNGNLIALSRVRDADERTFPFQHPAELERKGDMSWLLSQHSRPVRGLCWSQDSLHLLSASDDRSIGVWDRADAAGMTFRTRLRGHGARVTQATFVDPTSIHVVSSSTDGFSRLWNLTTHENDSREILKSFGLAMLKSPASTSDDRVTDNTKERFERSFLRRVARYQLTSSTTEEPDAPLAENSSDSRRMNADSSVHRGPVQAIQFAADGKSLVSGAADGTIAVWDTTTLQPVRAGNVTEAFREGHEFNVSRMVFVNTPNNETNQRVLVTSGYDGSLRFWNMVTNSKRLGVQLQVINGVGLLNTFATSADGQRLVTTAAESDSIKAGDCLVWSIPELLSTTVPRPALMLTGVHRAEVTAISISHDGSLIATGSREGVIVVWRANDGSVMTSGRAHAKNTSVTSLAWLRDGALVSAGLDGQLSRWSVAEETAGTAGEMKKHELRRVVRYERDRTPIERVSISPDEKQMLVISAETNRREKSTTYQLAVWPMLEESTDGNQSKAELDPATLVPTAVSVARSTSARIESERRLSMATVQGRRIQAITSAQWSGDGRQVLVSTDLGVQLFDAITWRVIRVFAPGRFSAADAQFADLHAESPTVATFDGTTVALWKLENGELISQFRGPFPVTAVAMSSAESGEQVLVAGASIRVFDGRAQSEQFGRPLFHQQKTHERGVAAIATGPKGTFAARRALTITGGKDGSIKLWRWNSAAQTMELVRELAQLESPVTAISWSDDASSLVAVTSGGQIASISIEEEKDDPSGVAAGPLRVFLSPAGPGVSLETCNLSSDGTFVVVAGQISETSESVGWVLRRPSGDAPAGDSMTPVCTFSGHDAGGVSAVAFVADSPYLISGGNDGSLILWNWQQPLPADVPLAYEAFRFLGDASSMAHAGPITSIHFHSLSRTLASASTDTTMALWNLEPFFPTAAKP